MYLDGHEEPLHMEREAYPKAKPNEAVHATATVAAVSGYKVE
jgi:hypothetical protein